jgi:urease accessory protein
MPSQSRQRDLCNSQLQVVLSSAAQRFVIAVVVIATAANPAHAHSIQGTTTGFAGGFEHPLTGPDHFLAMFAVGVWGAQMGGRSVWTLPVVFPLIMTVGGIAGMSGLVLAHVETGIAVSVLVLGAAITFAWRPYEWVPLLMVAIFAIFHGYAHGVELPNAADPTAFAAGFVIATGLIHICGIAVGLWLSKPVRGLIARGIGALIAVGGIYYLAA